MKTLVDNFPNQLNEALKIAKVATLTPSQKNIQNVIITGLGGSGIGGSIFLDLIAQKSKIPVSVNKDYFLPGFVNENSLVIVSSYSGNTEETLAAMNVAIQ